MVGDCFREKSPFASGRWQSPGKTGLPATTCQLLGEYIFSLASADCQM